MNKILLSFLVFLSLFISLPTFGQGTDTANLTLPRNMIFQSLDNVIVTNRDIPKDKPFMIIFFDPTCGHCQQMGKQLAKRIGTYPDITIWLVSNYQDSTIENYFYSMSLFPAYKLTVLRDYTMQMEKWFNFDAVPLMLLYTKDGKLLKDFDALPTTSQLNEILSDNRKK